VDRARRAGRGGISGLVELIRQHGEAIEFDLAPLGFGLADLVSGRLTFRRFRDLMASMPSDGTAMWRKGRRQKPTKGTKALPPPDDWWTAERDLLAGIIDHLAVLAWQRTEDGSKGRNLPKPIPRPGVNGARKPPRVGDPIARLEAMSGRSLRPPPT
jgi:hypothetical protein